MKPAEQGESALDISQFFKNRRGHHVRFSQHWESVSENRKRAFDKSLCEDRRGNPVLRELTEGVDDQGIIKESVRGHPLSGTSERWMALMHSKRIETRTRLV